MSQEEQAQQQSVSQAPEGRQESRAPRDRQGRGRGRDRDRDEGDSGLQETVVRINRCATVVKGGRRFSFSALVVVGDRDGKAGWGFGKANQVPAAVDKAIKAASRAMVPVDRVANTIPHQTLGKYGASRVVLIPASAGTGVIAGSAVRAVIEAAGIHDLLSKAYGSCNPVNLVKATFAALANCRSKQAVESLRGVTLDVLSK
jgi:small subunit ribosomal protein S5